MEIIYVWISDFKNIKKTGFHLSRRFNIEYNPQKNVVFVGDNKDDYVDLFKGTSFTNATAIVGKNGSGKSNLLEALHHALNRTYGIKNDFILVYNQVDNTIYYNSRLSPLEFRLSPEFVNGPKIKDITEWEMEGRDEKLPTQFSDVINTYFYSPLFEPNRAGEIITYNNISLTQLISNSIDRMVRNLNENDLKFMFAGNPYLFLIQTEILWTMVFAGRFRESNSIPFRLPEKLTINLNLNNLIKSIDKAPHRYFYRIEKDTKKILGKHYGPYDEAMIKNVFFNHLLWSLVLYYMETLSVSADQKSGASTNLTRQIFLSDKILNEELIMNFFSLELKEYQHREKKYQYLQPFLEHVETFIQNINLILNQYIENIEFIEQEISNPEARSSPFPNDKLNPKILSFSIVADIGTSITFQSKIETDFLDKYFTIAPYNYGFLNFSWHDLSSGEKAYLNLFSRFLVQNHEKPSDLPILVLIDEGEAFLHPSWQKHFFNNLVKVLPMIFGDKKIHLILTSHSPFLVSDLPNQNTVLLMKNHEGLCQEDSIKLDASFGGNIHSLYLDQFFIEDGVVGEFAKTKIQGILKVLKSRETFQALSEDEKKNVFKIINFIGEPIVKGKLQELMDEANI